MTGISRILAIVSAATFFSTAARGSQSVSIEWSASTNLATTGYMLHCGTNSNVYTSQINVGTNTIVTISGLTAGQTYYFAVSGYDGEGIQGALSSATSVLVTSNASTPPSQAAMPSVAVSPAAGPIGSTVFIYGTNLNTATGVSFDGLNASYSLISNSVLSAVVPSGAVTGPLVIATPSGRITSQFTVSTADAPSNDNFTNAQSLRGSLAFVSGDTSYASKEPGEPNHAGNSGGASIWYQWNCPGGGWYTLDPGGSTFETLLAVYTGTNISQLSVVASNAFLPGSPVTFQAAAGVSYQIAVDGYNGARGLVQLRLSPFLEDTELFSDSFDASEGVVSGAPLAGQNGWTSTVPALSGVTANFFPGSGQQGYIGFASVPLASNTVLLSHPINFNLSSNMLPVVEFSVEFQVYDLIGQYSDSFGWLFRNASGRSLFNVACSFASGQVTYTLDDGAGPRETGVGFSTSYASELNITADFGHNLWSASMNGVTLVSGQPITTTGAALTLGDIPAAAFYGGQQSGADGMFFDDYYVAAGPSPVPQILLAPKSQTVAAGSTMALGVIASGDPSLSYQWYFNSTLIPGATSPGMWLSNPAPASAGNYSVVVSNSDGHASASATVAVTGSAGAALLSAPISEGTNGRLVKLQVTANNSYHVLASTNLASWAAIGAFFANGSNTTFLDGAAATLPRRYYRLVSP